MEAQMSIEQMAQAHLDSVQQAIVELNNQKQTIDKEIERLTDYLEKGSALLNSTSTATVSSNF
jgi:IS30 family transposase